MARTEESNQRIRDEQKRKILTAANKVFARKGFSGTKMADIATEAGIGYGLLYHYFTNKELIFRAAVERATLYGFQILIQRIRQVPGTPWEHLYRLTTTILEGILREPEGFLLAQQAITNEAVPQEIKEMVWYNAAQGIAEFQQLLLEGQAAGQVVEGDAAELANLYFACIGGIALNFTNFRAPFSNYPRVESVLRLLKA